MLFVSFPTCFLSFSFCLWWGFILVHNTLVLVSTFFFCCHFPFSSGMLRGCEVDVTTEISFHLYQTNGSIDVPATPYSWGHHQVGRISKPPAHNIPCLAINMAAREICVLSVSFRRVSLDWPPANDATWMLTAPWFMVG